MTTSSAPMRFDLSKSVAAPASRRRRSTVGVWQRRRRPWVLQSLLLAVALGGLAAGALSALLVWSSLVSLGVVLAVAVTFGGVVAGAILIIGRAAGDRERDPDDIVLVPRRSDLEQHRVALTALLAQRPTPGNER